MNEQDGRLAHIKIIAKEMPDGSLRIERDMAGTLDDIMDITVTILAVTAEYLEGATREFGEYIPAAAFLSRICEEAFERVPGQDEDKEGIWSPNIGRPS